MLGGIKFKITDLIKENTIIMDLKGSHKEDIIDELIEKLELAGLLYDKKEFKKQVLKRESQATTAIGEGVAIPHAKTQAVKRPAIVFGRSKKGVDFNSLDGKKTHLFFMIAANKGAERVHLKILSKLAVLLMDKSFSKKLLQASSKEDILRIIDNREEDKDKKTEDEDWENYKDKKKEKILAVTSCPTGIAHTYMAADALKEKAEEMGVDIKIETNGSTGVENTLTKKDIKEAKAIIVSADTTVAMDRFTGKIVIESKVTDAIRKPEALIRKALKAEGNKYVGTQEKNPSKKISGKIIYDSLMKGVSNMLPFVVGGGILIALAYLFDFNNAGSENYGYGNSIASYLNTLGGLVFSFMLPILSGYIAYSIGNRPALAPGFIGGALSAEGNAGFLGALLAGFLAGYLMLTFKKIFEKLPKSLDGIKPVLLFPLLGILSVALIMSFIIIPPVKALNLGMNIFLQTLGGTNRVFLGVLLAGMMAVDMGDPINKAAYVFGVAAVAEGNGHVMAAVMAGGMVPPLGIAMATTFFKNKFTREEIDAGKANYIMGLSFITEGAIPFAAADPKAVIPPVVLGSALAGGLSELIGASSPAPHGGMFVIPLVTNGFFYLLSILVGALLTAILLKLLKKDIKREKQ